MSANPFLTTDQITVLRAGLGLTFYTRKPTRESVPDFIIKSHLADVDALIGMELLTCKKVISEGGWETVMLVTDEGRRVAIDEQAKHDAAHPEEVAKRAADIAKASK